MTEARPSFPPRTFVELWGQDFISVVEHQHVVADVTAKLAQAEAHRDQLAGVVSASGHLLKALMAHPRSRAVLEVAVAPDTLAKLQISAAVMTEGPRP